MRNAFAEELVTLAAMDQRIVLLSGDIGNRLFDPFKARFKNRFYNCGIAEANMTSMAAGMAMCGLKPITYTITPFNTTRCLEQIRNDICYHNVPVIIIGVGAGLSYSSLGGSHISCEDISFLRSLPNMTVLCPSDAFELRALLKEALKAKGPIYMRIGKKGEPLVYTKIPQVTIGKARTIKKGKDICIIATGSMVFLALQVAKEIPLSTEVISMHTIKPLDDRMLSDIFIKKTFSLILSLEEHSLIGGLGSAVAEWCIDANIERPRFLRFGTKDHFPFPLGSQTFLQHHFGLTKKNILFTIQNHIKKTCIQKLLS